MCITWHGTLMNWHVGNLRLKITEPLGRNWRFFCSCDPRPPVGHGWLRGKDLLIPGEALQIGGINGPLRAIKIVTYTLLDSFWTGDKSQSNSYFSKWSWGWSQRFFHVLFNDVFLLIFVCCVECYRMIFLLISFSPLVYRSSVHTDIHFVTFTSLLLRELSLY